MSLVESRGCDRELRPPPPIGSSASRSRVVTLGVRWAGGRRAGRAVVRAARETRASGADQRRDHLAEVGAGGGVRPVRRRLELGDDLTAWLVVAQGVEHDAEPDAAAVA